MKPFLKWAGGKTQHIGTILSRFPPLINNYHEPFLGGGSVLLAFLCKMQTKEIKVSGTVYASDVNAPLIGVYKNVQSSLESFIVELRALYDDFSICPVLEKKKGTLLRKPSTKEEALSSTEAYYYWCRGLFVTMTDAEKLSTRGSALFLFLNKTCFRGLYREGPNGFNVPFGHYTQPYILDEPLLRQISKLIQHVVFSHASFENALTGTRIHKDDFAYLDPPYVAEKQGSSFVSYVAAGFGPDNHAAVFDICASFKEKKISFLLSNANVESVRNQFPSPLYTVQTFSSKRSINSKNPNAKTTELLIS